jgi:hypothetical protein
MTGKRMRYLGGKVTPHFTNKKEAEKFRKKHFSCYAKVMKNV